MRVFPTRWKLSDTKIKWHEYFWQRLLYAPRWLVRNIQQTEQCCFFRVNGEKTAVTIHVASG